MQAIALEEQVAAAFANATGHGAGVDDPPAGLGAPANLAPILALLGPAGAQVAATATGISTAPGGTGASLPSSSTSPYTALSSSPATRPAPMGLPGVPALQGSLRVLRLCDGVKCDLQPWHLLAVTHSLTQLFLHTTSPHGCKYACQALVVSCTVTSPSVSVSSPCQELLTSVGHCYGF